MTEEKKHLTSSDYDHLCDACKAAVDRAYTVVVEFEPVDHYGKPYNIDREGPMMFAGDKGWLCGLGGVECDPIEAGEQKPAFIALPPTQWENPEYWR